MANLKVWGYSNYIPGIVDTRIASIIVAAKSRARASAVLREHGLNYSPSYLKTYWSITGNAKALAAATEEGVWYAVPEFTGNYQRLNHLKEV